MPITVQTVIDLILREAAVAPMPDTVDTLKTGSPDQPVAGIVTTFMATMGVLHQAVALGANFIITHEPTFYNHVDSLAGFETDPVVAAKRQFLEEHHLAVWRFHDYWHRTGSDGIMAGQVWALGWEACASAESPYIFNLPAQPLRALVAHLRERLNVTNLRFMGAPELTCQRVVMLPGAPPTLAHIETLREVGVLIAGETSEWQVLEYVRDGLALGQPKALILLGHERSEAAGMAYFNEWLSARLPGVPITHVPTGEPLLMSG